MCRGSMLIQTIWQTAITTSLFLSAVPLAQGARGGVRNNHIQYELKEREAQETSSATKVISMDEIQKYLLTFNDDSTPKSLSPFLLQLFDTDGDLPYSSLETVSTALEEFLIAEFNAVYAPNHQLDDVFASFRSQTAVGSGSQLLTYLNVTFAYEPSPPVEEVEVWLQTIMTDLSYFLQNLTALDGGADPELAGITSADQQPYYENGDRGDDPSPVEEEYDDSHSKQPPIYSIVPSVIAAALVVLLIGFFVMRRRRVNQNRDDPSEEERRSLNSKIQPLRSTDDLLEEDSDIFSFEVSLIESPAVGNAESEAIESRMVPRNAPKVAPFKSVDVHENESDLFSGIHSSVTGVTGVSPRNIEESRSIFSFLSGFTGTSASTVRHSNVTKDESRSAALASTAASSALDSSLKITGANVDTPRSRVSSLFAFSEEDEGEGSGSSDAETPYDEAVASPGEVSALSVTSSGECGPQLAEGQTEASSLLKGSLAPSGGTDTDATHSNDGSAVSSPTVKVIPPLTLSSNEEADSIPVIGLADSASHTPLDGPAVASSSFDCPMSPGSTKGTDESGDGVREGPSEEYSGEVVSPEKPPGRKWAIPGISTLTRLASTARSGTSTKSPSVGLKKEDPEGHVGENVSEVNLKWDSPSESARNAAIAAAFVSNVSHATTLTDAGSGNEQAPDDEEGGGHRGRRHAKNTAEDGTEEYQNQAMQPVDWSIHSADNSGSDSGLSPKSHNVHVVEQVTTTKRRGSFKKLESDTPRSQLTNTSTVSALSVSTDMNESHASASQTFDSSTQSPSKKLISDLVWLEKKIAGATKSVRSSSSGMRQKDEKEVGLPTIPDSDSISFNSKDANVTNSPSNDSSSLELNSYGGLPSQGLHSIVCRDCFAPPGKLKIVIHSTKDGPAVHTVKAGSSLEGHIFPGDLIISVDNVDTRSYTAEQVMKMMTARTKFERKITVLHFEQGGDDSPTK